jgi:hypothetical protein
VGGVNVDLVNIKLIELGEVTAGEPVPVTIATVDGKAANYEIRTSSACPRTIWHLRGSAALGAFEIKLDAVRKIESEADSSAQLPEYPPESASGPSGTVTPREGAAFEFAGLRADGSKTLPLGSGLKVSFDKIKEIAFGEETDGQVPVTITIVDGRTIDDTVDSGIELTGDTVLGTFSLSVKDIKQVVLQN